MESNRIEYKRQLPNNFEKELVAFLNYPEGGEIYVGINDDGTVYGVENIDSVQLKIKDFFNDKIQPSTQGLYDIRVQNDERLPYIKITIASGLEKPYYLKKFGMTESGCYIRVGSSCQKMTQKTIENLLSTRTRNSLRNIVSPRQDLTFAQLKIYYLEKGKQLNDKFATNLEFLTTDNKYNYIAYLFADENGNSMKIAKYLGSDKYNLIENMEFGYCSIIKSVYNMLDRLKIENTTYTKITYNRRIESNLVNHDALKEIFVNAVVHTDYTMETPPVIEIYNDRMTITSVGGLLNQMTTEDFFSGFSIQRNREIMRVFKDLELVEQLGSGMTRVMKHYSHSNFDITSNYIRATLPFNELHNNGAINAENGAINANDGAINANDGAINANNGAINAENGAINTNDGAINAENGAINTNDGAINADETLFNSLILLFEFIKSNGGFNKKQLAIALDKPYKTIEKQISKLISSNSIEFKGSKKTGGYHAKNMNI